MQSAITINAYNIRNFIATVMSWIEFGGHRSILLPTAIFLLNFITMAVYQFTNQVFPGVHYGLDWQIVLNGIDVLIYFNVGYYQGFSFLGFLLPLVVMSIILARSFRRTEQHPDRYHLLVFVLTSISMLVSAEITERGVNTYVTMNPIHGVAITVLIAILVSFSKWEKPAEGVLIVGAAVFFGLLPGDFLYGWVAAQTYPFATCIGGNAWGIGDGLWGFSLGAALLSYIFWHIKHGD